MPHFEIVDGITGAAKQLQIVNIAIHLGYHSIKLIAQRLEFFAATPVAMIYF
jgi:hypothetical protein